jgi:hypothetical protein
MGLRAAHAWRVSPSAHGCSVRTDESLSGLPARLFTGRLRRSVQADLDAWVRLLKLEAESRAAEEDTGDPRTEASAVERTRAGSNVGEAPSPQAPSPHEPAP